MLSPGSTAAVEQEALPPMVWLLVLAVAVVGSNSLVIGPIAPAIAAELGAGVNHVVYASAGFGLGTSASALFLARWIDKLGIVPMLRLAFSTFLIAFIGCALSTSVWMLVVAQLMAGLAAGVALPAIYAFAAKISPAGSESRILVTGSPLSNSTRSITGCQYGYTSNFPRLKILVALLS